MLSHLRYAGRWGRSAELVYPVGPEREAHADELNTIFEGEQVDLLRRYAHGADLLTKLYGVVRSQSLGTHLYVCGPDGFMRAVLEHRTRSRLARG